MYSWSARVVIKTVWSSSLTSAGRNFWEILGRMEYECKSSCSTMSVFWVGPFLESSFGDVCSTICAKCLNRFDDSFREDCSDRKREYVVWCDFRAKFIYACRVSRPEMRVMEVWRCLATKKIYANYKFWAQCVEKSVWFCWSIGKHAYSNHFFLELL